MNPVGGAEAEVPLWKKWVVITALLLAYSLICWWVFSRVAGDWLRVWDYRATFWSGWLTTVGLSAAALVLSSLIGGLAALGRMSSALAVRYTATAFVECVRGLPLLVLVLFGYYGVASSLGWTPRLPVGVLILSIFSGAYVAEILRAGVESVGRSQWDSARAIGLAPWQTTWFVILPQVAKQSLPPLAGQFSSIIKDSSLLSILGIGEFTFAAQQVNSATYSTLESYLPLAFGYLVLTLPISLGTKWLEQKFRYEH